MDAIVRSLSLLIIPRAVTRFLETYALNIAKLTQPLLANFLRISQTDFWKTHQYIGLAHEPNFLEIGLSPNQKNWNFWKIFEWPFQDLPIKEGCICPMVISSEFRMGQYRDGDHQEDAPHFICKVWVRWLQLKCKKCTVVTINAINYRNNWKFIISSHRMGTNW